MTWSGPADGQELYGDKSCPFCGRYRAIARNTVTKNGRRCAIECPECHVKTPEFATFEEAEKVWNTRDLSGQKDNLLYRGFNQYIFHHGLTREIEALRDAIMGARQNKRGYLRDPRAGDVCYDKDGQPTDMYVLHEILAGAFSDDAYLYSEDEDNAVAFLDLIIKEAKENGWYDDKEEDE